MADDLLSFKEFEPVRGGVAGGASNPRAEININSPQRSGGAQPSAFDENFGQLIDDMSSSVNIVGGSDATQPPSSSSKSGGSWNTASPADAEPPSVTNHSFFTIEYYQQFFDVDAALVAERILNSVVPRRASAGYLRQNIASNPDLYGPFWIVVTLIFSIAISGNVASYLQHADDGSNYHWRYNFHLVSTAATAIVMYVCAVPVALWAAFKWFVRPSDPDVEVVEAPYIPGLLTLICVYGYSMVIYIPVSILWVIQISTLQWLLVLSATFVSGSVLVLVLAPALRNSRGSLAFIAAIVGAHLVLGIGFLLYFFHVPDAATALHAVAAAPAAVETVTKAAAKAAVAAAQAAPAAVPAA